MTDKKVSFIVSAVDDTSETLDKVNKRLKAQNEPYDRLNKQWKSLKENSGLDTAARSLRSIGSAGGDVVRSVEKVAAPLAAITGAASIAGMTRLIESWEQLGSELKFSASAMGINVSSLSRLQGAARLAGGSADGMASGLGNLGRVMNDAVGGRNGEAVALFNTMGIALTDTAGRARSVDKVMPELADKVASIRDPFTQARVAGMLFGGAADSLLPVLRMGSAGMADYAAMAGRYGAMSDEGADAANRLRLAQTRVGLAVDGLQNSIAEHLEPILGPMLTDFAEWVALNRDWIATDIGDAVKEVGDWLRRMDWKGTGEEIKSAAEAVNGVVQAFGGWGAVVKWVIGLQVAGWIAGILVPMATLGLSLLRMPGAIRAVASEFRGMRTAASAAAGAAAEIKPPAAAGPPGKPGGLSGKAVALSGAGLALELVTAVPAVQQHLVEQGDLTADGVAAGKGVPDAGFTRNKILADAKDRFGPDTAGFEAWQQALDRKTARDDQDNSFFGAMSGVDERKTGLGVVTGLFDHGGLLGSGLTDAEKQSRRDEYDRVLATLPAKATEQPKDGQAPKVPEAPKGAQPSTVPEIQGPPADDAQPPTVPAADKPDGPAEIAGPKVEDLWKDLSKGKGADKDRDRASDQYDANAVRHPAIAAPDGDAPPTRLADLGPLDLTELRVLHADRIVIDTASVELGHRGGRTQRGEGEAPIGGFEHASFTVPDRSVPPPASTPTRLAPTSNIKVPPIRAPGVPGAGTEDTAAAALADARRPGKTDDRGRPAAKGGLNAATLELLNFYQVHGLSKAAASGVVANEIEESGLNTKAVGDGGHAIGLQQLHPDRQLEAEKFLGKPLVDASLTEQAAATLHELNTTERRAGALLSRDTTAAQAAADFSQYDERPADVEGNKRRRAALAEKIFAEAPDFKAPGPADHPSPVLAEADKPAPPPESPARAEIATTSAEAPAFAAADPSLPQFGPPIELPELPRGTTGGEDDGDGKNKLDVHIRHSNVPAGTTLTAGTDGDIFGGPARVETSMAFAV
jgi:hypothetical protein